MSYPVENALFQWREGERRVREAAESERADLDRALFEVVDELRRRLGSTFTVEELASFYASGVDWAYEVAQRRAPGVESAWVADAAFAQYAREASNYAGGRAREQTRREEGGVRRTGPGSGG
ncbi:MAG: hypothetical protein IRZ21_10950 [Thermoleophilaceae bacterium]|nr:hypothetical protein [Thermoleophilaceae bacterium]